ncbi:MAG: hypothetical protein HUJ25_06720 [Crocinitomicaceae bacterium]|nr:hypothetical protein [Crocinitomicaceae bacterium]
MDLSKKILEFLKQNGHTKGDTLVPVETIKAHIIKEKRESLIILKILDQLYYLEKKGLVETTVYKENGEFCVRLTEKGKKFFSEFSNPAKNKVD